MYDESAKYAGSESSTVRGYATDVIERAPEVVRELDYLDSAIKEIVALSQQLNERFGSVLSPASKGPNPPRAEEATNTALGKRVSNIRHTANEAIDNFRDILNRLEV